MVEAIREKKREQERALVFGVEEKESEMHTYHQSGASRHNVPSGSRNSLCRDVHRQPTSSARRPPSVRAPWWWLPYCVPRSGVCQRRSELAHYLQNQARRRRELRSSQRLILHPPPLETLTLTLNLDIPW